MARFAQAIETAHVDVVPKILIGQGGDGNGGGGTGNVMEALLAMLLSDKLGAELGAQQTPRNPAADAMRKQIADGMERR